jgi:hypothetical protein
LGNGQLATLAQGPFEEADENEVDWKIEEEVIGEQGLASLAFRKFAEVYKI